MDRYPEHMKQKAIQDKADAIGDFLEWLEHEGNVTVCGYNPAAEEWAPMWLPTKWRGGIEKMLAAYFDIDLAKLEEERRDMLARLRGSLN